MKTSPKTTSSSAALPVALEAKEMVVGGVVIGVAGSETSKRPLESAVEGYVLPKKVAVTVAPGESMPQRVKGVSCWMTIDEAMKEGHVIAEDGATTAAAATIAAML
jgi:hypothetical protein